MDKIKPVLPADPIRGGSDQGSHPLLDRLDSWKSQLVAGPSRPRRTKPPRHQKRGRSSLHLAPSSERDERSVAWRPQERPA
jgi:hypothetical protein